MARLGTCRDCGGVVSLKAKACPKCGRVLSKSLVGRLVSTTFKLGLLGFVLLVALVVMVPRTPSVHRPPGAEAGHAEPPARPPASLSVGDAAVLDLPGAHGVWLATTDADWDDLLDAENAGAKGGPGAGARIYRMASAGRARIYPNGTKVRVAKRGLLSTFVEVTEGEDRGRSGWVQAGFVKAR